MAGNKCLHQSKFFCTTITTDEGPMNAFACLDHCGFWLNFDPLWAGRIQEKNVPRDYRHDCWRLNTVSFLPHTNPDVDWKVPKQLSTGGKY